MIAETGVKPALFQPTERIFRARTAINQIADGKQPVGRGIEVEPSELAIEQLKTTVDIPDDIIAAMLIEREFLDCGEVLLHNGILTLNACLASLYRLVWGLIKVTEGDKYRQE